MRVLRVMALVAIAALAGCATTTSGSPARVTVQLLRGFSPEETALGPQNAPVVVLLDATTSMLAESEHGTSLHLAASRSAARLAASVSALRPVWLFTLGSGTAEACQRPYRGARAGNAAARDPLLEEIRQQKPRGEGSLAEALDSVRGELWRSDVLLGSRVVVFSDLGRECGGDVCAAAAKLIEGGGRLDIVAIGDGRVPACLREPAGLAESMAPSRHADRLTHFRVEIDDPEPMVAGCSDIGGLPVAVPPGPATVVVELDPPLRVGAHFAAGRSHVLQVLDFPSLDPPRRHWRWLPLDGSRPVAFPAPPEPDPGGGIDGGGDLAPRGDAPDAGTEGGS